MIASMSKILDLSVPEAELEEDYGGDLCAARSRLRNAYSRLSSTRPTLRFHFYYASRGDTTRLADNVSSQADQLVTLTHTLFSDCDASFTFLGASELIAIYGL